MHLDPQTTGRLGEVRLQPGRRRALREGELGDEDVEPATESGAEVDDVAPVLGDDPGDVGDVPGRSAPCTRRVYAAPGRSWEPWSGSGRASTTRAPLSVSGASAIWTSAAEWLVRTRTTMAKCPLSRVIVESSRLPPRAASAAVTSATMPGRSSPRTVTATTCWFIGPM
jgi:hypothetical protein